MLTLFTQVFLKFFFLFTPFFVISTFLALTQGDDERVRRVTAVRVTVAIVIISATLFLFGKQIFAIFGITLDAFRIGAGSLLFLSAVALAKGRGVQEREEEGDIAVSPLAVPVAVGPATTGAILVMAAQTEGLVAQAVSLAALFAAALSVGAMLYAAGLVERVLGKRGLAIMSKLTGLVLASIAAQLIFTGVGNFLRQ